jgi:hypothetical protein
MKRRWIARMNCCTEDVVVFVFVQIFELIELVQMINFFPPRFVPPFINVSTIRIHPDSRAFSILFLKANSAIENEASEHQPTVTWLYHPGAQSTSKL